MQLSVANINTFSMINESQENETVIVECSSNSGRFFISDTAFFSVKGIRFVRCGDNTVNRVEQLVIEDSIFESVKGRGTALALRMVVGASIIRSSFLFNIHSGALEHYHIHQFFTWSQALFDYVCCGQNASLVISFSNVSIISTKFMFNTAETGVLVAHNSSLQIIRSVYSHNQANVGGAMVTCGSIVTIHASIFNENSAEVIGGVIMSYKDAISISSTKLSSNSAGNAGVLATCKSLLNIISIIVYGNTAEESGGVIYAIDSTFIVSTADYAFNTAASGGVIWTCGKSLFSIVNSSFTKNRASYGGVIKTCGAVLSIDESSFSIINSTFTNNRALFGGVIIAREKTSFSITSSTFTNNSAYEGAAIWCIDGSFIVNTSMFNFNVAEYLGGTMAMFQCSVVFANGVFDHNRGSLYAFTSNLIFSGHTTFEKCAEAFTNETSSHSATIHQIVNQEGGAITGFGSTLTFAGVTTLLNNQASYGGAVLAAGSTVIIYGEIIISNNTAVKSNGGGIFLLQSTLLIKGNCTICNNHAVQVGGGIYATSSTVAVLQPWTLKFVNNEAVNGGGIYLQVNSKLNILKTEPSVNKEYVLIFVDNHAMFGGAVYVDDSSTSHGCLPINECFIQTLALYRYLYNHDVLSTENVRFSGNTATEQVSNLFGGMLDRCIPSPFAEVQKIQSKWHGFKYLTNISTITLDSIASLPVRVCFCDIESEPDCSYQPSPLKVKKGEIFTVSLVAVDQVNHTVSANITSSLSNGRFGEGQQRQSVGRNCTDLVFSVFTPHDYETITLFADGPCGRADLSQCQVNIRFLNCTCPVGFEPLTDSTRCECICDSKLSSYITYCNSMTSSFLRVNKNAWITYVSDRDPPGYVIYPYCPLDYCQHHNVSINLNIPNGADAQCDYSRGGVLCGACQKNHSLSLGSSHCLPCHSYWPAVFVVIFITAIIAGLLLVTALSFLNMTVAVGLINCFIFYGNIVEANRTIFFPSSEPSFPTVFVAWLDLAIGLDVCFIDGLDTYTKTWLQLAFPVYIISLVVIVIMASEWSPTFARLIGKKNPIATLATLILLSYAKLLTVTITALSFAVLHYPDGSQEIVWLPDGSVKYFQGKHIALVLVALMIIIIGLVYTAVLFLWQWLVRAPKWKVLKWTRSTRLNVFIATYHAPYHSKYRCWTGLLLLVRVVLYTTEAVTVSSNPQITLLVTIMLIGGLFLLRGSKVHRELVVEIVDRVVHFNLLALAAFTLYDFKNNSRKQTAVVYTSTVITFFLLVGVILYHVALLIKKDNPPHELDDYLLFPVRTTNCESIVTSSGESETTEDRKVITLPYQQVDDMQASL